LSSIKIERNFEENSFNDLYNFIYKFYEKLSYIDYDTYDSKYNIYPLPESVLDKYNDIKLKYDFGYNNLTAYTKVVEFSDNEYSPELTYYFKVVVKNDFDIDVSRDKIYKTSQSKNERPIIDKEFVIFSLVNNIYDSYPIELNNYLKIKES
jgi:hypothetical protein